MKRFGGIWLKKAGNNGGFTLIEVISSFAVLAIISVALLQMFVLSTKSNQSAFDMDKANALCVEMSELYKADPTEGSIIKNPSEFTTSSALGVTVYTRYYNLDWSSYSTTQDSQSVYRLDIEEQPSLTTTTAITYHPEFAWEGGLNSASGTNLDVYSNPPDCYIKLGLPGSAASGAAIKYTQGTSTTSGTAVIPIRLDCSEASTSSAITLNVHNTAQLKHQFTPGIDEDVTTIADLYLCDVPSGASITVEVKEGIVSYNSIVTGDSIARLYTARVSITRLKDDFKIAENNVSKYLVIKDE